VEEIPLTDYRKLFDLTGKTAVVLGAASGIGKASAEALAGLGASVVCADRAKEGAEATAAGIRGQGGSAEGAACDAADAADVAALATLAMKKFSQLDIAVTTPGLNIRKTILDYTEEDLDRVINLNIKGTVWFFQAFVRVNAIAPSIVETALTAPFKERPDIHKLYAGHTVFNRWSSADEVATAVAYLASDAASYVSGSTLFVDGGWTGVDGPPTGLTQLSSGN
jgi:NAD(P)-dependent dehydrogenase (short-subunit alcohol dehydrogenase family)